MRPATIRRLLVFGVCAVGVAGLYLVPGVTGAPQRVAPPTADREPRPAEPVSYPTTTAPVSNGRTGDAAGEPSATAVATATLSAVEPAQTDQQPATRRDPRSSSSAPQRERPDRQAPSSVTELSFPTVTPTRVTIRWPRATDNVGVVRYRVWLNGYQVADTSELQVAVPWFNDGSRDQVVQVRAVDDAGNESGSAPARLVQRPDPDAVPTSTPTPSTRPSPTAGGGAGTGAGAGESGEQPSATTSASGSAPAAGASGS